MKLKSFWNHLQLKKKILMVFLPLTIVSTLAVLITSISLIIKNGRAEALANAQDKLLLVSNQTDQILTNVKYNIKAFSTSPTLQNAINESYPDTAYGNYMFSTSMHASVDNIMDIPSYISSGYIHTFEGKVYDVKTDQIIEPTEEMKRYYDEIAAQKGKIIISSPDEKKGGSALNISKSLIDIKTGNLLGILSFDIKESLFYDSYKSVSDKDSEHFYLIDDTGTILSSDIRKNLQTAASEYLTYAAGQNVQSSLPLPFSHEQTLILSSRSGIADYYVVYTMNYYKIYKEAVRLALMLSAIGIAVLITALILSGVLAQSLVRPITLLAACADEAGRGNFDAFVPIHSRDEIGVLSEHFQHMNANIKELTTCIYNEQNQKKEYELNLLQAQINPHFLYNCLDNISSLVSDHKNDTALSITYHLGQYYRTILSKGRNIITIKEELHLIRDYLEIQLVKSPLLFTYSMQIEDALYDLKILKMLLQPIVENSVIHGFAGYKDHCHLSIDGFLKDSTVFLIFKDDGRGMNPKTRDILLTSSAAAMPRHFGLKNIQERIQLKFGPEYGLTIISEPDRGTQITVSFPKTL